MGQLPNFQWIHKKVTFFIGILTTLLMILAYFDEKFQFCAAFAENFVGVVEVLQLLEVCVCANLKKIWWFLWELRIFHSSGGVFFTVLIVFEVEIF